MLQSRLYYARKPPIVLFKRLMSEMRYPTLTSTGDPKKIVTSLGLNRISTMILSGKPNRPFPAEFGVDIDEMTDGGKQAISLVTKCVQTGEWENLEELLSNNCIKGLRQNLENVTSEERSTVGVNDDDIFFSFISDFQFQRTKQSILLVTFSMPRLGELRQIIADNKEVTKAVMDKIKSDVKDGTITREQAATEIPKQMKETLENLKNENGDHNTIFRSNDIVIGNYRFERENSNYEWTIVELSQIDSRNAWSFPFQRRWKGRLGISLRGYDFYNVLRLDYITDWSAFIIFFNIMSSGLLSGGMIGAPHS